MRPLAPFLTRLVRKPAEHSVENPREEPPSSPFLCRAALCSPEAVVLNLPVRCLDPFIASPRRSVKKRQAKGVLMVKVRRDRFTYFRTASISSYSTVAGTLPQYVDVSFRETCLLFLRKSLLLFFCQIPSTEFFICGDCTTRRRRRRVGPTGYPMQLSGCRSLRLTRALEKRGPKPANLGKQNALYGSTWTS